MSVQDDNVVRMTIVSFSFSAVARLGVPPGKWFCLARTGLGFSQYSCCVCGLHHEKFLHHWRTTAKRQAWGDRLDTSINSTLRDLGYYDKSDGEADVLKDRLRKLINSPENYIVNPAFAKFVNAGARIRDIRILTDGPACLPRLVLPSIPLDQVITNKSGLTELELSKVSDVHVGTNASDARISQTRFIVSRTFIAERNAQYTVVPRLTDDIMTAILGTR